MADILLITDLQLTKGSPLGGNIDIDKYRSVIKEVQIFVIEPILGTKLFDKILADFDAATIAGVYNTILVDYLQPIIINSVTAEYIDISGIVIDNAGMFTRTPEDTQPISSTERGKQAAKYSGKADVYIDRLQRYLDTEQANIAEYTFSQDNNYDVKPDRDVNLYGGLRLSDGYEPHTTAEREIWRDIWKDEGR